MYYYLAHFPKIDFAKINEIRSIYDPNFKYVDPHIAIVFPVGESIGVDNLSSHISSILEQKKSFAFTLSGLSKSWDHYLYLEVGQGKEKFIRLHDDLYTGILAPHLFREAGYIPHITLGFFADRQAKFDKSDINEVNYNDGDLKNALSMAQQLDLNFTCTCDALSLVSRDNKESPAKIVNEFELK